MMVIWLVGVGLMARVTGAGGLS